MKRLISSLLILPFLLLTSPVFAKSPVPLLKHLSPSFDYIEVQKQYKITYMFLDPVGVMSLQRAVQEWNNAIGKDFLVITDVNPTISVSAIPLKLGLKGIALPYINNSCAVMLSQEGASNYKVIMHELGHCFGLAHMPEVEKYCGKLMHPRPRCMPKFKKIDRRTIKHIKRMRRQAQ